jgi:hypothetical protein
MKADDYSSELAEALGAKHKAEHLAGSLPALDDPSAD